jgi:glycosyltransferase involved in cell wall biosynthesis
LTIFIPCYGSSPYLTETLKSVWKSFPPEVKIVIIDDGSPTSEVMEISKLYSDRLLYIRNHENQGIARTFNQAVALCDTEYLSICGSDDFYDESYYQNFKNMTYENPTADLIILEVKEVDSAGNIQDSVRSVYKKLITSFLKMGMPIQTTMLFGNHLYFPSLAWRHSTLRNFSFSEEHKCSMDWLLLTQFVMENTTVSYQKNSSPSFYYRRHDENFSKVFFERNFKAALLEDKEVFFWIKTSKYKLNFLQKILTHAQFPIVLQDIVFFYSQLFLQIKRIKNR